jgi:quinol monooxygenase YgiN
MPLRRGADYGCESYEVSEDIEAPHTFVLVARSRDLDAHYEHFRNLKLAELTTSLGEVLTGQPQVTINEVASTPTLNKALARAKVGG